MLIFVLMVAMASSRLGVQSSRLGRGGWELQAQRGQRGATVALALAEAPIVLSTVRSALR
jgi:hypothetical protein